MLPSHSFKGDNTIIAHFDEKSKKSLSYLKLSIDKYNIILYNILTN